MAKSKLENLLYLAIKASLQAGAAIMEVYTSSDFEITVKSDRSPLTLADRNAHLDIEKILSKTELPIISEEGSKIDYSVRKNWEYFWMVDPLDGTKEFIKKNGEFTVNIALINKNRPVLGVIYVPVTNKIYFAAEGTGAYSIEHLNINDIDKTPEELISSAKKLEHKSLNNTLTVIASRSHMNIKTSMYIHRMKKHYKDVSIISKGSSLKLCLIAESIANVYPRHSPTMEWDTAAGHAIINCSGGRITVRDDKHTLEYNKENLLNPGFTAYSAGYEHSL
jgi:3'(2'), 5'-bisphosphate nucleotidase